MVGAHGVDRVLMLDKSLKLIGFGIDGGDFTVESADPVGTVCGLDGDGGGGLGWGRELSGIGVLGKGSVVIVVGVGDGG